MAEKKEIKWTVINDRMEKDCGIPKSTSQEVMTAFVKTAGDIARDEVKNLKEGDSLVIKSPAVSYVFQSFPEHVETDEKGRKFEISKCIGMAAAAPTSLLEIANSGFTVTRKEIK